MTLIRMVRASACFIHLSLKNVTEPHIDRGAFSRKTDIDAIEDLFRCVEAEPETGRGVHVSHLEFTYFGGNLAGIGKERKVKAGKGFPAILCVDYDHIPVAETEVCETTEVFGTPKRRQQVEGNLLVVVCSGERCFGSQSDDASLIEERNIALHVDVELVEIVKAKTPIFIRVPFR